MNLEHLHIIAFTHKDISLDEISRFHLEEKTYDKLLVDLKEKTGVEELMYLCTCNRVEFLVVTKKKTDSEFVKNFFESFEPTSKLESIETILSRINVISGEGAVKHLLNKLGRIPAGIRLPLLPLSTQYHEEFELFAEKVLSKSALSH